MTSLKRIVVAALLVTTSLSLSSCGKSNKNDAAKSAQQLPPNTLNPDTTEWPSIEIADREKLNEKIQDKKLTIAFKVKGKSEGFDILCRHGKVENIQEAKLKTCANSYIVDGIENGGTYAFEIHAKNSESEKQKHLDTVFLGTANPNTPIILVEGEDVLKKTFNGMIDLKFSMSNKASALYKCQITGKSRASGTTMPCDMGFLSLNLNEWQGNYVLYVGAFNMQTMQQVAEKTLNICGGSSCSLTLPAAPVGVPGPGYPTGTPSPLGGLANGQLPASGTIFDIPIAGGVTQLNLGRFWSIQLPPRYHVLSYTSNQTFIGANTIEQTAIIDDPLSPSPFCSPFDSGSSGNGRIITILDGDSIPRSYCQRYFNTFADFQEVTGYATPTNSLEFSSNALELATYERFALASYEIRDPDWNDRLVSGRFDALCSANFREEEVDMNIINNFLNNPYGFQVTKVRWCQTLLGGVFGAPLEVWVAGFFFEEQKGASSNAAKNQLEMTYIASAAGFPTAFNPAVFLRNASFRVRTMIGQSGLNAPYNNYTP